jgi:MoaA/NifB/PqqE/SkfB family radical SAM enzyme
MAILLRAGILLSLNAYNLPHGRRFAIFCGSNTRLTWENKKMHKIIGFETISVCNLTCKMCPAVGRFTGEKLSDDCLYRAFEDIARYNQLQIKNGTYEKNKIHTVRFDGNNESLINKNLPDLIRKAKSLNPELTMYVCTNGLLLTGEMSGRLIEAGVTSMHLLDRHQSRYIQ